MLFLIESRFIVIYSEEKRGLLLSWILYLGYSMATFIWAVDGQAAITNSMSLVLLSFIVVAFFSTELTFNESNIVDYCWIIAGIVCIVLYVFGDKTSVGEYGSRTFYDNYGNRNRP